MNAPPALAAAGPVQHSSADSKVLELLRKHGDHSSGFLTFNQPMEHYVGREREGLVAYRGIGRRQAVQLCGPLAQPEDRAALLDEFLGWAKQSRRRITAVQLRHEDVPLYLQHGFRVNQLGSSFSIDLESFGLRGTRFMKVRNKISRARRLGTTIAEVSDSGDQPALAEIDAEWLRGKGRHVSELAFLVGERGGRGASSRRVFVATLEDRPVAYITYSPVFGAERPGWLYDLTRRRADTPPGVIELLFLTALEQIKEEGVKWLHLGMTPFVGLSAEHELDSNPVKLASWFIGQLEQRGAMLYPAATQQAFKLKWNPAVVEPEYIAFQGRPSPGALIGLLRLTRSIPF
ncbi:MAG TPA: DUF2156 domain-containing protein [Solirubrobacteraceae bacterium]|nr:DUF2156 domain-containing protein [Solirubrobacteraceae bacterium]